MRRIGSVFFLAVIVEFCYPQGQFVQTTTSQFNANSNVNIDTQNNELKLTNDVGNGVDGNLNISDGDTLRVDSVKVAVTYNNSSGQPAIRVSSIDGFSVGDEVLLITMQDNNSNLASNVAGQYEFRRIINKIATPTALILDANLIHSYDSTGKKHQVLKVPNYNNVIIGFGAVLTCDEWNGSTGGIICFRAKGVVNIAALAKIIASYRGFRGGLPSVPPTDGHAGEGIFGFGTFSSSSNSNGGGGGRTVSWPGQGGGGGGGSYGTLGAKGLTPSTSYTVGGDSGLVVGDSVLSKLIMGGAGGAGSAWWTGSGWSGAGGRGGGVIYISCDSIMVLGMVQADGDNGGNQSGSSGSGGGGGGAGGSIQIISNKNVSLGNRFVTATAGQRGLGYTSTRNGGGGGKGRIRIDADTSGVSDPSVGHTDTTYAAFGTSTTPVITKLPNNYWGDLTYTKNAHAGETSVTVDVLDSADSVLLSSITSGTNITIAGIGQGINTIKLQTKLTSSSGGMTPLLYDWAVDRSTGLPVTVECAVNVGWNLVSVPVMVQDWRKVTIWPTAISPAYTFDSTGYRGRDTLRQGEGYWLKFNQPETVVVHGYSISADTITVAAGWNLIGAISGSVDTSTIVQVPPGIVSSAFYGYSGGYVPTDSLCSGQSYWVKARVPGMLILAGGTTFGKRATTSQAPLKPSGWEPGSRNER